MKQKVLVFLVLLLLTIVFSLDSALAQEVNLSLDGTASFNTLYGNRITAWYSTVANVNDDNTGTRVGFDAVHNVRFAECEGRYESIVEFAASTVNSVAYYRYYFLDGASGVSGYEIVSLYYNDAWNPINTQNYGVEGSGTGLITITSGGPWYNVTRVKIEADMHAIDGYLNGAARASHYTYELRAFGTSIVSPTVVTNDAADIQDTSATLNGDITDTGGEDCDERGFEWGTSLGGPYPNTWTESGSFGTGVFNNTITGLDSETTYYFRVKVYNSAGWGYGEEKSFTTASSPPPPCENHNIYGWAYSENIGWISFSCRNTMAEGTGVDYGVDVDPVTGLFSGYAWSENIGWISFEPVDVVGCPPSGTCQASIDLGTGLVSGWAKVLIAADGWDGWIGLSGTWANGVSLNSGVGPPSEFEGWAWGDDVIGWISFNDKDFDGSPGPVDYQVMSDISIINNPPYVEFASTNIQYKEGCDFSPTGRIGFVWTYQDKEGDQQDQYNLQIATDSGFSNLVVDVIVDSSPVLPGGDGTSAVSEVQSPTGDLEIAYGYSYFWRVRVKAATGSQVWSDWEEYNDPLDSDGDGNPATFTSPSNPYPKPSFTWDPLSPPAEVEVTFTDNSTCYTGAINCKDDVDTSYEWDFDNDSTIDDVTKGDTVYTYLITGDYTVRLYITDVIDGVGRTCYQEESLTASLPLPTWKEIVPF